LFRRAGAARKLLVVGYCMIVIDAIAQILTPAVFRVVLNDIQSRPRAFVRGGWVGPALCALALGVTFLTAAYISHTWTRRGAAQWSHNLRRGLYEHVQQLSMDFFQRSHVGDIAGRMNQDIERLEVTVWYGLVVVWASVMLILGIALIAWIDVGMALVAGALLAVSAMWSLIFLPRLKRRTREVRDELGSTAGTVTELLSVNALIKAFNAEDHAVEQVNESSERVLERSSSLARLQHRYTDTLGFHVAFVAPFVLLFFGAWRAAHGTLHLGDVVAIWAFWQMSCGALTGVLNNVPELLSGLAASERAAEMLDQSPSVRTRPGAGPLKVTDAAIRFEGVSFSYPGRPDQSVLHGFDLSVRGGERLALVGPSGAGKSTVAQLLFRFYDPTNGRVTIDGQDVRAIDQRSLRDAIGVVVQENVLLSGSLARNLRLAKPDATDAELTRALEAANAWDFVQTWEHGIDTPRRRARRHDVRRAASALGHCAGDAETTSHRGTRQGHQRARCHE
jgi:ABC-type multidrug transport system fused ATPase/permease subunit